MQIFVFVFKSLPLYTVLGLLAIYNGFISDHSIRFYNLKFIIRVKKQQPIRYYNSCMLNIFLSMVLKRKTLSSIRNKNKTFFQAKIQSTYFLALINRFLYKIMRPCSVGPAVSIQAQWFYESLMWNPPFISIFAHSRSSCATYRVNAALSSKSAWPFAVSRGLKCDFLQTGAQHTHYTLMWPSVCVTPTHIHWP